MGFNVLTVRVGIKSLEGKETCRGQCGAESQMVMGYIDLETYVFNCGDDLFRLWPLSLIPVGTPPVDASFSSHKYLDNAILQYIPHHSTYILHSFKQKKKRWH